MTRFLPLLATLGLATALISTSQAVEEPQPFAINCKACHLLDQALVGPSLVELAKIYNGKPEEFLKWTRAPGKKRPKMIQMPSMAHVSDEDINTIYTYIVAATKGVTEKKSKNGDPFANHPHTTRRPRVQRTFLPNAGPASLYVALPGEAKLNLVWDTTLCRLRYITEGEHDDWPYLRGNGNAFASIGKSLYTEEKRPFLSTSEDQTTIFKGYRINSDGLPSFIYTIGPIEFVETITGSDKTITRTISIKGDHELIDFETATSSPLSPVLGLSGKNGFTITHTTK